ncbi:hypothetical protein SNEBB_002963 [Seison nebaliae]|nr:hypothetical protein SNEBB_002963 [Seison nebaliae]
MKGNFKIIFCFLLLCVRGQLCERNCEFTETPINILKCVSGSIFELVDAARGNTGEICDTLIEQLNCVKRELDGCPLESLTYGALTTVQNTIADCCPEHFNENPPSSSCFITSIGMSGTKNFFKKCFPPTATIMMGENGKLRRMANVSIGDEVLAYDPKTKNIVKTKIVSWLHLNPNETAQYVDVVLENEKRLTLSYDHMVLLQDSDTNKTSFKKLSQCKIKSDRMFIMNLDGSIVTSLIEDIEITNNETFGVYAPLTETGTLIVDGFLVTSYAHIKSFKLAQFGTLALRKLGSKTGSFIRRIFEKVLEMEEKTLEFFLPSLFK